MLERIKKAMDEADPYLCECKEGVCLDCEDCQLCTIYQAIVKELD